MRWFEAEIERFGGVLLHAEGQFEGLDAGLESGVGAICAVLLIEACEQVQLPALCGRGNLGVLDVFDESAEFLMLRVDPCALEGAGQKGGLPVFRVFDGQATGAHGNEAREVLVFAAESVQHPCSGAGAGLYGIAAIHKHQ